MGFIYTAATPPGRARRGTAVSRTHEVVKGIGILKGAAVLPPTHGAGGCLILPDFSILPCDGERTDSKLGLKTRPHGGVVVAATRPNDLTGTKVGGHGEDHWVRSVALVL